MKMRLIVSEYIKLFPDDYKESLNEIRTLKDRQTTDFAELKDTHAVKRVLFHTPVTLHNMFMAKLSGDEYNEVFNSKDKQGARWFATEFPQFAISK